MAREGEASIGSPNDANLIKTVSDECSLSLFSMFILVPCCLSL